MNKKRDDTPLVSIIVPTFNVEKYIDECLLSIINQTLKKIEIICCDGGSTDGTVKIIKKYITNHKNIKLIYKENSGYGQSLNDGIKVARGKYIGIVESDDSVESDMYSFLYKKANEKNLDWIRSDIYFYYAVEGQEKKLERDSIIFGLNYYNVVLNPQIDPRPYRSALRTWAGIYKKDFLIKNNIWHNETPGGSYQDVGFFLKTLYYAKRIMFVDETFYKWRQTNPNSSIHYDSQKLVEKSLKEWELNKEYLKNNALTTRRMWGSFNYRRYFSYLWTIQMADKKDQKELKKFVKKELRFALLHKQIEKSIFGHREWIRFLLFLIY